MELCNKGIRGGYEFIGRPKKDVEIGSIFDIIKGQE